jgi:hypothetical protein
MNVYQLFLGFRKLDHFGINSKEINITSFKGGSRYDR